MKHSSFDAAISALDADTSAHDVETSAFGAATSAIARRYRRGVSGDIGDCGVGITPQMCNRVTNHGDMSTSSKPVCNRALLEFVFQEQSYSSLHSGRSLAWDHVRGDIDDHCGAIADSCGVIADPCGVVTVP